MKASANEATTQACKCPRASNDLAFSDSAYSMACSYNHSFISNLDLLTWYFILAANLALNNESIKVTLAFVAKLVTEGGSVNPSETVLCSQELDLHNNIITTIHYIEYLMQYHQFIMEHHSHVLKSLKRHVTKEAACKHCSSHDTFICFKTSAIGYHTK